jgi:hypothetical protein
VRTALPFFKLSTAHRLFININKTIEDLNQKIEKDSPEVHTLPAKRVLQSFSGSHIFKVMALEFVFTVFRVSALAAGGIFTAN